MSTPLSACTPRDARSVDNREREEKDLSLQMQRMIALQYEQQRMFAQNAAESAATDRFQTTTYTLSPPSSSMLLNSSLPNNSSNSIMMNGPSPPSNSASGGGEEDSLLVGQGTLILPPHAPPSELLLLQRRDTDGARTTDSGSTLTVGDVGNNTANGLVQSSHHQRAAPPSPPIVTTPLESSSPASTEPSVLQQQLVTNTKSYGALDAWGDEFSDKQQSEERPIRSGTNPIRGRMQRSQQHLQFPQTSSTSSLVLEKNNSAHSNHPHPPSQSDPHHPPDNSNDYRFASSYAHPPHGDDHDHVPSICSLIYLFFSFCFFQPLRAVFCCCCSTDAASQSSLHRSFVYGSIDGMLTGAGIVSAFLGLDLLPPNDPAATVLHSVIVAFTAAACCADSVCMALGHCWTTQVHATAQAAERTAARQMLQTHKAQTKSTLVDLLVLERGMLKLDAMSLVDTLEGYPDLFVSAVTGDALVVANANGTSNTGNAIISTTDQEEQRLYQASTQDNAYYYGTTATTTTGGGTTSASSAPSSSSATYRGMGYGGSSNNSWRGFLSYGRLTELDMDPDLYNMRTVVAESRKESLCMMLGFSLLSVVPSLIFTWVPVLLTASSSGTASDSAMIHPHTLVIFLTSCVMWCLGVWKSRFMDSNWLLFGIETVLVLLICIICAYGLGATLKYLFFPDNYVLQVVKPVAKQGASTSFSNQHSYYHGHDTYH